MSGPPTSPWIPRRRSNSPTRGESDHMDLPLDLYEAPFRHFGASLAEYVTGLRTQHGDGVVIAVVPEVVTESPGRSLLHSHTSRAVRRALLPLSGVAILTVPFLIAGQRSVGRP